MLKKLYLTLAVLFTVCSLAAADAVWNDNYEEALKQAKAQKKYLLINFTGSDWCGFCVKLDKEVFSQKPFQKFAKKNLILMKADFPRRKEISEKVKKQNAALAKQYGVRGFPMIVILTPDGKEAERLTGFAPGSGKKYLEKLKKITVAP